MFKCIPFRGLYIVSFITGLVMIIDVKLRGENCPNDNFIVDAFVVLVPVGLVFLMNHAYKNIDEFKQISYEKYKCIILVYLIVVMVL